MESGVDSKLNDNIVLPSSSLSQNPFLVTSDTTNDTAYVGINHGNSSTHSSSSLDETHHSLTHDMLVGGNLFHEETPSDNKVPVEVFDTWQNQPTTYQIVPTNNVESHNPFQVTEQGHQGMASAEASDIDSFMPKQEHNYDEVVASQHSTSSPGFVLENGTNKGLEIQNPPVQVMERSKESVTTSSEYVFPSHVFARNTTNAPVEWSTASNESLFSIYMGNMSFSSDHPCFKSTDLDINQANTSPNNNPQPQVPVNKFNDISQRTAELHEENSKVTEARAAETMREVIMENFQTEEHVGKKEDKKPSSRHQSDDSANSYSFKPSGDKDKNISSKSVGEKQKPQKQAEPKEAANAADQAQAQPPKSNASPRKWLNCFSCCTLCR